MKEKTELVDRDEFSVVFGHLEPVSDCQWCDDTDAALRILKASAWYLLDELAQEASSPPAFDRDRAIDETPLELTRQVIRQFLRALGVAPAEKTMSVARALVTVRRVHERLSFACGNPHKYTMLSGVFAGLPRNRETAELFSELADAAASSCGLCGDRH